MCPFKNYGLSDQKIIFSAIVDSMYKFKKLNIFKMTHRDDEYVSPYRLGLYDAQPMTWK